MVTLIFLWTQTLEKYCQRQKQDFHLDCNRFSIKKDNILVLWFLQQTGFKVPSRSSKSKDFQVPYIQ